MKVLVDTNVVLDVVLERNPHAKSALTIFSLVETGKLQAVLCATTLTTIYYLATKVKNATSANRIVQQLLQLFEVGIVNRNVLENACSSKFSDFEDSVIHEAAVSSGAQAIITRDRKGFKHSSISVYTPKEVVRILEATQLESE